MHLSNRVSSLGWFFPRGQNYPKNQENSDIFLPKQFSKLSQLISKFSAQANTFCQKQKVLHEFSQKQEKTNKQTHRSAQM